MTPDKDFVMPAKTWRTKEINPQEIAESLRGRLEESTDADSQWNIYLDYGTDSPVLLLKLHPEKRTIHVATPGPEWRGHKTYRFSAKFANVEDLLFAQYYNPDDGVLETDILINVRDTGTKWITATFVVSGCANRTFECERKK